MVDCFNFKILVVGPFAAGKTTFIRLISDVSVVGTEVSTTGDESQVKATTTAGIEYGTFTVWADDLDVTLLLFGTPGQERFADVREIAAIGADGLVVIVNGEDPSTWSEAARLYREFRPSSQLPAIVVVNRWPEASPPPEGLLDVLGIGDDVLVAHGDIVDPNDARRFLVELLTAMLVGVADEGAAAL